MQIPFEVIDRSSRRILTCTPPRRNPEGTDARTRRSNRRIRLPFSFSPSNPLSASFLSFFSFLFTFPVGGRASTPESSRGSLLSALDSRLQPRKRLIFGDEFIRKDISRTNVQTTSPTTPRRSFKSKPSSIFVSPLILLIPHDCSNWISIELNFVLIVNVLLTNVSTSSTMHETIRRTTVTHNYANTWKSILLRFYGRRNDSQTQEIDDENFRNRQLRVNEYTVFSVTENYRRIYRSPIYCIENMATR